MVKIVDVEMLAYFKAKLKAEISSEFMNIEDYVDKKTALLKREVLPKFDLSQSAGDSDTSNIATASDIDALFG